MSVLGTYAQALALGTALQVNPTCDLPAKFFWEGLPSWLPTLNGIAPLFYADFVVDNYWYNGLIYTTFTSWLAALSGSITRAGSATYAQSGVVKTAPANTARFPSDFNGNRLGIRLTGQIINLALQSQAVGNVAWSHNAITSVTDNTTLAPDNTTTAGTVVNGATNTPEIFQLVTITSGAPYTLQAYAHPGTNSFPLLAIEGSNVVTQNFTAIFDLTSPSNTAASQTAGGSGGGTVISTKMEPAANGFYKISVSGNIADTGADIILGTAGAATGNTLTNGQYAGSLPGQTIIWWGVGFANQSYPFDYIPTAGATASQLADTFSIPFPLTTAQNGTFMVKATSIDGLGGDGTNGLLSDGTGNNWYVMIPNNATQFGIETTANTFITVPNNLGTNKVVVSGGAVGFLIAANGLTPTVDGIHAFLAANASNLVLGNGAHSRAFGNYAKVAAWTIRATTGQGQALSALP